MNKTFLKSTLAISVLLALSHVANAEEQKNNTETNKLDTIVVTASGYEQSVTNAPASISVITAEEIAKKSYSNITDVLKNVPGVFVQGGGSNQSVSIRGMGASYTLYLIDGKPMNDGGQLTTNGGISGASVNFLPPVEAIERIEVIRGAASSLYGSDAMGGVINIITKKHQDKVTGGIRTEYVKPASSNEVNNDEFNTSVYVNTPLIDKLLSLQVTAGYQNIDESDLQVNTAESGESDPEFKKKDIGAKFVFTPNDNNTIIAEYSKTSQERTHTPGKSFPNFISTTSTSAETIGGKPFIKNGDNYYPAYDTGNKDKGKIVYQTDMIPKDATYTKLVRDVYSLTHEAKYGSFELNSYAQYNNDENTTSNGREVTIGQDSSGKDITVSNPGGVNFKTLTLNSQGSYFTDNNSLTLGANYKKEKLIDGSNNGNPNAAGTVTKMDRYQWSLFGENTWKATNDLALTFSGRYDDNEYFGSNFSPKVYAVYNATDSFTIKGGVISGYKAPDLRSATTEYTLNSMGGALFGNPNLKPEKSMTYEGGLAFNNADIGLLTSLMLYKTDFKDKLSSTQRIEGSQTPGSDFYLNNPEIPYNSYGYRERINVDEVEFKGIEFTTDYNITDYLKFKQSYTYTDSKQKSGDLEGYSLNAVPKHMFNAGLDWDVSDQVSLWTQLNYRGKTESHSVKSGVVTTTETKAYTFVDLGALYKYDDQLEFSTGIYNLANKNVVDDGNSYVLDGRRYSFAMNFKF